MAVSNVRSRRDLSCVAPIARLRTPHATSNRRRQRTNCISQGRKTYIAACWIVGVFALWNNFSTASYSALPPYSTAYDTTDPSQFSTTVATQSGGKDRVTEAHSTESNPQQICRYSMVVAGLDELREPVPKLFDRTTSVKVSFPLTTRRMQVCNETYAGSFAKTACSTALVLSWLVSALSLSEYSYPSFFTKGT